MVTLDANISTFEKLKQFVKKNSDLIALIVGGIYIVFFTFVLLERSFDIGIRYHEIDSYALPTISIQYRGSFVMRPSDLILAQRDFPELYSGINSFEDLRSSKLLQATENSDTWLAYYFPIYSLVCIPLKFIYQIFGDPQYKSFIATNVILITIAFVVILFCSKMPKWYRVAYICLLSMSPLEQYCTYIGAEIMIFSFVAMSIMFYYDKAYCRAGILVSLASLANPTILFFGLLMIANYIIVEVVLYYKNRKDLSAKQICWQGFWKLARLGVCYLIVFVPFIMNFIYLGISNGTFGLADFQTLWQRYLMYLFDLNLGFASFSPIAIIAVILMLPFVIKHQKKRVFWIYGSFFISVFAYSIMFHINCGMYYTARYVIWSYPLLAFLLICILCEIGIKKYFKISLFTVSTLSALIIMTFNCTQNVSYTHLNRLSQVVLDHAPALYSPMHSTFYSRTVNSPHGGYTIPAVSVYYDCSSNHIRKILIQGTQDAKDELFSKYTAIEGDVNKYMHDVNTIPNDGKWHYFNINPNSDYQVRVTNYTFDITELGFTPNSWRDEEVISVSPGGAQYGPYCKMSPGEYLVAIYGEGLQNTQNDAAYNSGEKTIECSEIIRQSDIIIIKLKLTECGNDTDIRTYNLGEFPIKIKGIRAIRLYDKNDTESAILDLKENVNLYGGSK